MIHTLPSSTVNTPSIFKRLSKLGTISNLSCLVLFVLIVFSTGLLNIDIEFLLGQNFVELTKFDVYNSTSQLNRVLIPALFAVSFLLIVLSEKSRRKFKKCRGISWFLLVIVGVFIASVWVSEHGDITLRRTIAQWLLLATLAFTVLTVNSQDKIFNTVVSVFVLVMLVDVGLYLAYGAGTDELNRFVGIHGQKNISGNVYGLATVLFLQMSMTKKNSAYLFLFAISAILLYLTQSKTSMATVLIFLMVVPLYRYYYARLLTLNLVLVTSVLLSIMFSLGNNTPELITNRGDIWNFLSEYVWLKPFMGYGYASFWAVGESAYNITDASGFITQINTGHNGYIDLVLGVGLLGSAIFLLFGIIGTNYVAKLPEHYFFVHYVVLAFLIANVTETFLFYYHNLMWLLALIFFYFAYLQHKIPRKRRSNPSQGKIKTRRKRKVRRTFTYVGKHAERFLGR